MTTLERFPVSPLRGPQRNTLRLEMPTGGASLELPSGCRSPRVCERPNPDLGAIMEQFKLMGEKIDQGFSSINDRLSRVEEHLKGLEKISQLGITLNSSER